MASQPSTAVTTIPSEDGERFSLMQREARLFAASPLIPQHLRQGGPEQAMANCYIALKMARTMGEDPLVVLQNIHVVNGKAGFASQYMIARANSSGVFRGRMNWRVDRSDPKNLAVTAYAAIADTGEVVEFTCDMKMAEAEGWTKNPKYRTMPEVMLRYRSAAFLVRFYAPDVMLGYHTSDEVEDVGFAVAPAAEPLSAAMLVDQSQPVEPEAETADVVQEAEIVEPEAPAPDDQPEAPATELALDPGTDWQAKAQEFLGGIRNAKKQSYLDAIEEQYRAVMADMPKQQADAVEAALLARRGEIGEG